MHCTRNVTEDIVWIGGNDRRISLFENLYPLDNGVSYNSYLIKDEKTCLMDTVDYAAGRQFLENLAYALDGRDLDYMVIQHMEPDHCSILKTVAHIHPEAKIVVNAKTVPMMKQFLDFEAPDRLVIVKENDTLELGSHTLTFVMAPMVHWPEVMMTYDSKDKVLFSADGFGTFGAINGTIFADEVDYDRDWLDDSRRYYCNIVGKYGTQVQAALKKAAGLDIQILCPLHGVIWRENLGYILDKYNKWSTYEPEEKGVMIVYASMYGNTENMAEVLAFQLAEQGVKTKLYDVSTTHCSWLVGEAFHYSHIVVAAPTYNSGLYPLINHFFDELKSHGLKGRTFAFLDNGTWAATAGKQMAKLVEEMKDMTILDEKVSIKSSLKNDQMSQVEALAAALKTSVEA